MSSLATFFKTESKEAGDILCKLFEVLCSNGAEFHPGVAVHEKSGHIGLFCTRHPNEKKNCLIIRMPRCCFIPTSDLEWLESDDLLSLAKQPLGLTRLQHELLNLHIELYNVLGKIPWLYRHHPDQLLKTSAQLLASVQQIKPGYDPSIYNLSQRFIKTRSFNTHTYLAQNQESERHAIIPILDFMNHSHQGLQLTWSETDVSFEFESGSQSKECHLNYGGRRDVMDLALSMGYYDGITPYASSASMKVIVPEIGAVVVEGLTSHSTHTLNPPRVEYNDKEIRLSHITVDLARSVNFHIVMDLVVQGFLQKKSYAKSKHSKINSTLKALIIKRNIKLLNDIYSRSDLHVTEWPSARILHQASLRQIKIWEAVIS